MNRFNKLLLFIFFIFLLYSIKVDLSITPPLNHSTTHNENNEKVISETNFTVVSYKMKQTDTFISVIDQLNPQLKKYDLNKMMDDFENLNPNIEVSQLQPEEIYLFPVYQKVN